MQEDRADPSIDRRGPDHPLDQFGDFQGSPSLRGDRDRLRMEHPIPPFHEISSRRSQHENAEASRLSIPGIDHH